MLDTHIPSIYVFAVIASVGAVTLVVSACLNAMSPHAQLKMLEDEIEAFERVLRAARRHQALDGDTMKDMQSRVACFKDTAMHYALDVYYPESFRAEIMAIVTGQGLRIRRYCNEVGDLGYKTAKQVLRDNRDC